MFSYIASARTHTHTHMQKIEGFDEVSGNLRESQFLVSHMAWPFVTYVSVRRCPSVTDSDSLFVDVIRIIFMDHFKI
jgi:hypothetical protein